MEILAPSDGNLRRAGARLAEGGLVALPTETVYGLGADAFNARAVARVFEAKARPSFDPLIVHIAALGDVEKIAAPPGDKARALMETLWPGPLTLVMRKLDRVPGLVTSGLPTVAVRFPDHPIARAVISYSGTSIAAPSANPFGYLSPTRAEHVARMLGPRVDIIVDGGACAIGVESTVLDMTVDPPALLRPGGMELARIEAVIGPVGRGDGSGDVGEAARASPGRLESHYAPRTRLRLFAHGAMPDPEAEARRRGPKAVAALFFDEDSARPFTSGGTGFAARRVLSPVGDLVEAAASLFALLHELDGLGLDEIWAETVPDRGLGPAINDRLRKASAK